MSSKTEIYKQNYSEDSFSGLVAIQVKEKEIYGDHEAVHIATDIHMNWAVKIRF